MHTKRGQSALALKKNSIFLPQISALGHNSAWCWESHFAFLCLSSLEGIVFSCTLCQSDVCARSAGPVAAIGKQLISKKLACKNTENSFSLCINMKGRKNGKMGREDTNHFSPHFIFTLQKCDCWQGGGQEKSKWDECVCKSNDSKTSLTKRKKVVKSSKKNFSEENSVLPFWLLAL